MNISRCTVFLTTQLGLTHEEVSCVSNIITHTYLTLPKISWYKYAIYDTYSILHWRSYTSTKYNKGTPHSWQCKCLLTCDAQCRAVLPSMSCKKASAPLLRRICRCWGRLWKADQCNAVIPCNSSRQTQLQLLMDQHCQIHNVDRHLCPDVMNLKLEQFPYNSSRQAQLLMGRIDGVRFISLSIHNVNTNNSCHCLHWCPDVMKWNSFMPPLC